MHFIFQLGKLLGCVVGLKNSVTGITIIAIGTSLPDTFASRSAALHDIGADASIGNITGQSINLLGNPSMKACSVFSGVPFISLVDLKLNENLMLNTTLLRNRKNADITI